MPFCLTNVIRQATISYMIKRYDRIKKSSGKTDNALFEREKTRIFVKKTWKKRKKDHI